MGILDDLKREAEQARQIKEDEEAARAERERIYRDEIRPRIKKIHQYLIEMVEQLQLVNRQVKASYPIPCIGMTDDLIQENYRVFIDRAENPKKLIIQFDCCARDERSYEISAASSDEFRQFLIEQQVRFSEWPVRDGQGQIASVIFKGRLRVRVALVITADIENSRICVTMINFEGLSVRDFAFEYARVDDVWLDQLGHYVLRKSDHWGSLYISDEDRKLIQQLAREEQARRLRELEEIGASDSTRKTGVSGIVQMLRDKLFKSPP